MNERDIMPSGTLEHANITVSDIERSSNLFQKLLGWHERWRGEAINRGETIHVGDERTYLALYTDRRAHDRFAKGAPLNHLGLLVDDLDAAEKIVLEAGLETFNHADYSPGRRFYFFDWDGIEFEIVSYA
jgi:catechol 2,3-dioxygenase-like lactoylglutathione lyase family enzyme